MTWILLDMDGTLTPSGEQLRGDLESDFRRVIGQHRAGGTQVAVVSGAPIMRMRTRLAGWWGESVFDMWAACNGGEVWADGSDAPDRSVTLEHAWGASGVAQVLARCETLNEAFSLANPGLPFAGPFVERRSALVNWCPIGRGASQSDRAAFTHANPDEQLRQEWLGRLRASLRGLPAAVTLGGRTSFDVFPREFAKDQVLNWATGDVWYIADAIGPDGNDWHLAERLGNRAIATSGPQETLRLLRDVIPIRGAADTGP